MIARRISTAVASAAFAVFGVNAAPDVIDCALDALDSSTALQDTAHLGKALVDAAALRNDAPMETLDTLTCAADPCKAFIEPDLAGLRVSGKYKYMYVKTGVQDFRFTATTGRGNVFIFDTTEGGARAVRDDAPTVAKPDVDKAAAQQFDEPSFAQNMRDIGNEIVEMLR